MWGRFCHKWMETGEVKDWPELNLSDKDLDKYTKLLNEKISLSGVDRDWLWPHKKKEGFFEVPFALNCGTNYQVLQVASKKDGDTWRNGFSDEWLTGTSDYISEIGRKQILEYGLPDEWAQLPWIDDFKTGQLPHKDDPQLMAYALMRWLIAGKNPGGSVVSLTHWPKYPKRNPPQRYFYLKTPTQLTTFHNALKLGNERFFKALQHKLENRLDEWLWPSAPYLWIWSDEMVEYSSQCNWCKSKDVCPKYPKQQKEESQ